MKISVKNCFELKGKTMALEHTYELPQLVERNKQLLSVSPVYFQAKGTMEAGLFVVKGELKGEYFLACSRCLTEVQTPFELSFEERFLLTKHQGLLEDGMEEEWEDIHSVEGQEIDLQPYIEDEILMSIPFIPVCASEQECSSNRLVEGKDWTVLTDETKRNKVDPRLAELAKLLDQDKG